MESIENIPSYTIRQVTESEWEKLRDIRTRLIEESPQAFGDNIEQTRRVPPTTWEGLARNNLIFVIENDQRFIATAGLRQNTDGVWLVTGVWTDPEYRGRGLGRKLLKHVIEVARTKGIGRLQLGVNQTQISAIKLYESLGFEKIFTLENEIYGDGKRYNQDNYQLDLAKI